MRRHKFYSLPSLGNRWGSWGFLATVFFTLSAWGADVVLNTGDTQTLDDKDSVTLNGGTGQFTGTGSNTYALTLTWGATDGTTLETTRTPRTATNVTITNPTDTVGKTLFIKGVAGGANKNSDLNLFLLNTGDNSNWEAFQGTIQVVSGKVALNDGVHFQGTIDIGTGGEGLVLWAGNQSLEMLTSANTKAVVFGTTNGDSAGTYTLTVGGSRNLSGTFAGSLQNRVETSTTTLNLVKQGTGTWTLTGKSTYTGTTTVSGGILNLQGGGALEKTGSLSVQNATLQFDSGATTADTIRALPGIFDNAAKIYTSEDYSGAKPKITLGIGGILEQTGQSKDNTFLFNPIVANGGMVQSSNTGDGMLVLAGTLSGSELKTSGAVALQTGVITTDLKQLTVTSGRLSALYPSELSESMKIVIQNGGIFQSGRNRGETDLGALSVEVQQGGILDWQTKNSSGQSTFSSNLTGSGTILLGTSISGGTYALTGNNTAFTGTYTLGNNSTVNVASQQNLGNAPHWNLSGTNTMNAAGTEKLTVGNVQLVGTTTWQGAGWNFSGTVSGEGTLVGDHTELNFTDSESIALTSLTLQNASKMFLEIPAADTVFPDVETLSFSNDSELYLLVENVLPEGDYSLMAVGSEPTLNFETFLQWGEEWLNVSNSIRWQNGILMYHRGGEDVPEPGSWMLLLLGSVGCWLLRLRERKKE
ncbi:MAG: autotransporter-associated beta strand repeat-containing protein [Planctomycetia bacterium]|nr:autotransporter-associated beta strand repeat-containing protein [Planctomycetia bacterium]